MRLNKFFKIHCLGEGLHKIEQNNIQNTDLIQKWKHEVHVWVDWLVCVIILVCMWYLQIYVIIIFNSAHKSGNPLSWGVLTNYQKLKLANFTRFWLLYFKIHLLISLPEQLRFELRLLKHEKIKKWNQIYSNLIGKSTKD